MPSRQKGSSTARKLPSRQKSCPSLGTVTTQGKQARPKATTRARKARSYAHSGNTCPQSKRSRPQHEQVLSRQTTSQSEDKSMASQQKVTHRARTNALKVGNHAQSSKTRPQGKKHARTEKNVHSRQKMTLRAGNIPSLNAKGDAHSRKTRSPGENQRPEQVHVSSK